MQSHHHETTESIHHRRKVRRSCTKSMDWDFTVAAEIEIVPHVHVNKDNLELERMGPMTVKKHEKSCSLENTCKFIVQQNVTVHLPIHFHAKAQANRYGIVCDRPSDCYDVDRPAY